MEGRSSPTGYEAFIKDANEAPFDLAKTKHQIPMLTAPVPAIESHGLALAEGSKAYDKESAASNKITDYFPSKACEDACGNMVPGLAASSSSDKSDKDKEPKEKKHSWVEKMGQCHMDMACGKLEIEFMKEEDEPPKLIPLTEQGELLKIEGPPPPKLWTEELSDNVQEAQKTVSKKANRLLISLGLAKNRNQHLMTDYYHVKEEPKEPEISLSEKMQSTVSQTAQDVSTTVTEMSSNAHNLVTSGMASLGRECDEAKGMIQKKMTDYDANKSAATTVASSSEASPPAAASPAAKASPKAEAAPALDQETPNLISTAKEVTPEGEEKEKKTTSWNSWKNMKGFLPAAASPAVKASPKADAAPAIDQETPNLISTAKEAIPEGVEKEKKSTSWNSLKNMKGFLEKFKLTGKTPSCPETSDLPSCNIPEVVVPSFTTPKVKLPSVPKVELPSLSIFTCTPDKYQAEPTMMVPVVKVVESIETEGAKSIKTENAGEAKPAETNGAEETKEEEKPVSLRSESPVPW